MTISTTGQIWINNRLLKLPNLHIINLWRMGGLEKIFSQLKNNNKLFIETYLRPVNFAGNNQGTLSVFY
ncbi:hypothetical protein NEILACOT_04865 [Neisseria lactamica ATCC 23970]|uniref:Uncharacterized protein n=1 Tax=Neisseria lactamica ATCC 23970 TaxID=546265 RepID=D0WBD9_NEILA|nr:hypothetical protein NEILACOT_04865 [Neisseria lactamica ATCC 23970]